MIGRKGPPAWDLSISASRATVLDLDDEALVELGKGSSAQMGLLKRGRVIGGSVVRVEKAYPVYDPGYQENLDTIRRELAPFKNLSVIGRNGMHKYNNQDHSMMTAMLAVRNLEGGNFNLWNVNTDAEYHEEGSSHGSGRDVSGRLTPRRL